MKGAKRVYNIESEDMQDGSSTRNATIELTGIYTVTAYILGTDGRKSADATATIIWANPIIEGDEDNINMLTRKALLVRSDADAIAVEGLESGEVLELYNTNGMLLDKVKAADTTATLGNALQHGNIYIIMAGERSVKYRF